ncbi:MAG: lipoate--protein ligase family protein [bacterium]|nr:MAG: lipoate--protein ligase family protein [bacterium]
MNTWRFLNTGLKDGFHNMAIDEVLATKSVPHDNKSVFRVYRWQPYAISLGYNQDPHDLNLEKCKHNKIDVVRRPTGGSAVLHAEEITYSIIVPKESEFYSSDILKTYNLISKGILKGLNLIGVKAELIERVSRENEKRSAYKNKIPCFSRSAKFEIAFQGKKLVGSAQRRFENSILQHGSILVGTFHLNLADYIAAIKGHRVEKFRQALASKTISISQILPIKINYDKIIWAIKTGFQQCFNIYFFEGQLTPRENAEVQKLVKKYQKLGGKEHEN